MMPSKKSWMAWNYLVAGDHFIVVCVVAVAEFAEGDIGNCDVDGDRVGRAGRVCGCDCECVGCPRIS